MEQHTSWLVGWTNVKLCFWFGLVWFGLVWLGLVWFGLFLPASHRVILVFVVGLELEHVLQHLTRDLFVYWWWWW